MAGNSTRVFIVSGPSGSGKTTVVDDLLAALPGMIFSVSYTTRAPREGEQNGREYFFVSREEFEAMKARGEFLEQAMVYADFYGTHRSALEEAARQGKDLLLDIDVQGALQVKKKHPAAIAIMILPPSAQELEKRLRARGLDTAERIARRLKTARWEVGNYPHYDYVVINRDREQARALVRAIVAAEQGQSGDGAEARRQADRARPAASSGQVSAILETFPQETNV